MHTVLTDIDAAVIVALDAIPDGLTLSELARVVGSPVSSLQRCLGRLTASGLADRHGVGQPRYRSSSGVPRDALRDLARWRLGTRSDAIAHAAHDQAATRELTRAARDPATADAIARAARRSVWWRDATDAVTRPRRMIAGVMADGTWEDVELVRGLVGDAALEDVLAAPPPGVFDRRSWVYWHARYQRGPAPPLPTRRIA
jgi:hypothetical protein